MLNEHTGGDIKHVSGEGTWTSAEANTPLLKQTQNLHLEKKANNFQTEVSVFRLGTSSFTNPSQQGSISSTQQM